MSITIYSKPGCVQCTATDRHFGETPRDTFDVTQDAEAMATVRELGYMAAPVVVIRDDDGALLAHWAGYNPDKINAWRSRAA